MVRHGFIILAAASLALAACSPLPAPAAPGASADPGAVEATPAPGDPEAPAVSGSETPAAPPYAPQANDAALARGEAFLDEKTLLVLESYPPQIVLTLAGSLPTPCHQLRVAVAPPDAQNRISVAVYAVADPNAVCVQVLQSFEQNVNLGAFPAGVYTVWVNGERVGEFIS